MSHALTLPPPGFDDLTVEEQVDYVQALWERVSNKAAQVPAPSWHLEVVRERVAAYEADPQNARSWREVRARILADLKR
jgi:putative addiction module component (TIGR02574 family)